MIELTANEARIRTLSTRQYNADCLVNHMIKSAISNGEASFITRSQDLTRDTLLNLGDKGYQINDVSLDEIEISW